ncbi:MAG: replication factor C large subunit [Methanomicrobiales archaeon]|nr:replication factor C large subunit [Methanomicrobiales archaeon]
MITGQTLYVDWAEEYRPIRLQDVVGNGPALRQMVEWAQNWSPNSKPLLLYGKPGTGKTSSAHALAHDMGWDVVELNASDQRTKSAIEQIAGSSSVTRSLSGASRKLILLDEADDLHGTADRGGAKAILDLFKTTRQPVILIANDIYSVPAELKSRCDLIQFRAIQARSMLPRLKAIAIQKKVRCSDAALKEIAESAGGDMRAGINMLYAAAVGRDSIADCDIASSSKDARSSIFDLISSVFHGRRDADLIQQSREIDETPDVIEQWVEGNLEQLRDRGAIGRAYRYLSRADELIGLTLRRQYYILWRYASAIMLFGTSLAAGGQGIHSRIQPPARWRRMGTSKRQKAVRGTLFRKIAERAHIPQGILRERYLTPLTLLIERSPEGFAASLDLDADELNFFLNDRTRAAAIVKGIAGTTRAGERAKAPEKQKEEKKAPAKSQSSLFDGF